MAELERCGPLGWLQRSVATAGAVSSSQGPVGLRSVVRVEQALAGLELQLCGGLALRGSEQPTTTTLADQPDPTRQRAREPVRVVAWRSSGRPGPARRWRWPQGWRWRGCAPARFCAVTSSTAAHAALRGAAERMAPLVLHADLGSDGHGAYHAIEGSGCFQPHGGFGPAGRRPEPGGALARRAVALSRLGGHRRRYSLESLELPDAELVRSYLGAPGESVDSATEAQRILLGHQRARLPAWHDPSRPVAATDPDPVTSAEQGRRLFFREPLTELARLGMDELSRLTGRPLSFVGQHSLDDAEVVLVGQGVVSRTARAVADALRDQGLRLGVLDITWLRPFPSPGDRRRSGGSPRGGRGGSHG